MLCGFRCRPDGRTLNSCPATGGCLSTGVVRCQCSRVKVPVRTGVVPSWVFLGVLPFRCRLESRKRQFGLLVSNGQVFIKPPVSKVFAVKRKGTDPKTGTDRRIQQSGGRHVPPPKREGSRDCIMSGIPIDNASSSAGSFLDVRCSWTSVPCIKSIASAGQLVVHFVTGQMVGDRRSPGRQYWGARLSTPSANHRFPVPPTGSVHRDGLWTVFEMAGPVLPDECDDAASFGLCVAAAALSVCVDVAASLLPTVAAAANSALPTLRRHNESAAAEQTAVDSIILFIAQLLSRSGTKSEPRDGCHLWFFSA